MTRNDLENSPPRTGTETEPPQHLLGGLNVAILAAPGCRAEHVWATKKSLEESGVNVQILAASKGPVAQTDLDAVQAIADADPELFDAVVLPGGQAAAECLRQDDAARSFIERMAAEDKPTAAMGESGRMLVKLVDGKGRILTVGGDEGIARFHRELKALLANRRRERFATESEDQSSAVGVGG